MFQHIFIHNILLPPVLLDEHIGDRFPLRALRRLASLIHSTDKSHEVPHGLFLHVLSVLSIHDHPGNIFMRWVQTLCLVTQTVHQGVTLGSRSTSFNHLIRKTGEICDTSFSCFHRIISSLHTRDDW